MPSWLIAGASEARSWTAAAAATLPGMRGLGALLTASAVLLALAGPAAAADQTVTVADPPSPHFSPGTVRINPGDTVTWNFTGLQTHNVTADPGQEESFVSPDQSSGTFSHTFTHSGNFTYRCTELLHSGTGTVSVNTPPVADFSTPTNQPAPGEPALFDASAAQDPDGSIASYRWDLDGDGSLETDTGTSPQASASYPGPGDYTVRLQVTDNEGVTHEVAKVIGVRPGLPPPPTGGPAQAGNGLEVALQDDPVFVSRSYYNRDLALRQAHELRVTWIRVNVIWARAVGAQARSRRPPARVGYQWSPYDSLIDAAAQYGIKVELTLTGPAPAFASGKRRIGPIRPNVRRFGQFARAAAEHFRGRVERYSIWNEPNLSSWLSPQDQAPSLYRSLYRAGWRSIKSVDPSAQVLIGETAPYARSPRNAIPPLQFLRDVTCVNERYRPERRCRLVADGYAHHPYDFAHPPHFRYRDPDSATLGTISRLTRALTRLARVRALRSPQGRPLDVYLTEYGYYASGKQRVPDGRRAAYLSRAYEMARKNPRVRQLLQYLLVKPPRGFPGGYFNLGIVNVDGRPTPAFGGLSSWARVAGVGGRIKIPIGALALPAARTP
jgi:plastocyanin